MRRLFFSTFLTFLPLLGVCGGLCACTIEHAEEQIVEKHVNGTKKTSVWVYPDGEILKRNELYDNGIKEPEEHYDEKGDSVGALRKWHDNGVLAEENNCNDAHGYIKRYGRNCKILEYFSCENGLLVGEWKKYYESYEPADSAVGNCEQAQVKEEGIADNDILFDPHTTYRADGSLLKKITSDPFKGREKIQWFDEQNNVIRESFFTTEETDGPVESSGISYGTCENSSTLFCAETSFVQSANPSGTLDSSTLSFKDAYKLSIGKYPASLRYIKAGHVLLYEEFWAYDDPPSNFGDPALRVSRSFYPDSMGGRMASESFWQRNLDGTKRHGIWRNWYPSGILKDSLTFVNGERVGEQFSYDSTGKLTIHKTEAGKNRPVIMHLLGE